MILVSIGFAVTISVLTFGIGFIPLTLFGTVLATKIGISVITSMFFIVAISFLGIFIYDTYKYKLAKNLSNNITIDREDTLPNFQIQSIKDKSIQKSKDLFIDYNNSDEISL